MNSQAAKAIMLLMPLLAAAFYLFTRIMPPLLGYAAALAFYWCVALVPLIIWQRHKADYARRLIWPDLWVTLLMTVMLISVSVTAYIAFGASVLPLWALPIIAIIALLNGTLEEVFWRGTMLTEDAKDRDFAIVLGLFVVWHLALLFQSGVAVTGGALGLLGGAFFGGLLWTLARKQTNAIGFCIASHIALNLFAFTELASQNATQLF